MHPKQSHTLEPKSGQVPVQIVTRPRLAQWWELSEAALDAMEKAKNISPNGFAEQLLADHRRSAEGELAKQIGTGIDLTARRKNETELPIAMALSPLESAEGILVTTAICSITKARNAKSV